MLFGMGLRTTLSSHRFLLGGLAAALGLTTAAAPVLADVATAAPTDTTDSTADYSPQTIGTYESCSAYFGLSKSNSNLASFDVVNNTTGPDPVIANSQQAGPTLVPVVTLTDASNNTFECTPELGWTDQATWEIPYVGGIALLYIQNIVHYPGTGFWVLPGLGEELVHYDGSSYVFYTPVSGTLRFESNLVGVPIHASMTDLPTADAGFDGNIGLTLDMYQSPLWNAALNLVTNAPSGDAAQAALLDSIANGFVNGPTLCDNPGVNLLVPDANFAPLLETLKALLPIYTYMDCGYSRYASSWLVEASIQLAKIANAPATVTVGDPPPPTTTTTVAPEEPVAPAFTG
jgi:hypothetical protein